MTSTHSRRRALRSALGGQRAAGNVLVDGLPAAERDPEATGEHLGQRRRGLGDDGGVIAVTRGIDHAEREGRRLQRGPQPGPGEPGVPLPLAPGREVVRAHHGGEAGPLGGPDAGEQLARCELLVRCVIADRRHASSRCGVRWRTVTIVRAAPRSVRRHWPRTATCVPRHAQDVSSPRPVACWMQARPGELSSARRALVNEPGAARGTRARSVHGAARPVARERRLLLSGRRNVRRFRRRRRRRFPGADAATRLHRRARGDLSLVDAVLPIAESRRWLRRRRFLRRRSPARVDGRLQRIHGRGAENGVSTSSSIWCPTTPPTRIPGSRQPARTRNRPTATTTSGAKTIPATPAIRWSSPVSRKGSGPTTSRRKPGTCTTSTSSSPISTSPIRRCGTSSARSWVSGCNWVSRGSASTPRPS